MALTYKKAQDNKDLIIQELLTTIGLLGGKSDILSIIGSYGDTLDNKTVLEELKYYNKIKGQQ